MNVELFFFYKTQNYFILINMRSLLFLLLLLSLITIVCLWSDSVLGQPSIYLYISMYTVQSSTVEQEGAGVCSLTTTTEPNQLEKH